VADPLSYLPYALASGRGTVDGYEAQQLVAAGLTLLQRSARLVRALAGRRAAILAPTGPAFLTGLAACEGRGAVLVNPLATPAEIAHQLAEANVGAVFTTAALATRVPETVTRVLLDEAPRTAHVVHDGHATSVDLGAHFGLDLEGDPDVEGAREECAVVFTSAMAGRPLGAILTHRNLLANARATIVAAAQTRDDHVLALLPWAHLFGLTVTAVAPLVTGARVTTVDRFHPARTAAMLADGVTEIVGVPAVFRALLPAIRRRWSRLDGALRLAVCGGAQLDPRLQDEWFDATGVELRQGYGLTEAGPVCLFNRVDAPNRRGMLGVPLPGVEMAVARPAGSGDRSPPQWVDAGTQGELVTRGPHVFAGYVSDSDRGLARTADGWLRTGDLGVANADGTFEFHGLCKPMFTRNGFNVYPAEVERAIGELAGVVHVRAYAVPDAARENDVAVDVAGAVTVEAVKAWCAERMSAYKRPSTITIVPAPDASR